MFSKRSLLGLKNKVTSAVAAVVFLVVSIIVQHQLKICSGIGYHSSIETYACIVVCIEVQLSICIYVYIYH